jgi:hypothetical protein
VFATLDQITGYGVSQGWLLDHQGHRVRAPDGRGGRRSGGGGRVHRVDGQPAPALLQLLQSGQKDEFNAAMAPASRNPVTARNLAFRSRPYGGMTDLFDLFTDVEKKIIEFTSAQGANFHCQPIGRQLTHTKMFDWLAEHLPK